LYDACRNAPYGEGAVKEADGAAVRMFDVEGAALIAADESDRASQAGLFIAYATSPGKTADDAWGPQGSTHSPFTEALLRNLPTPGVIVEEALLKAYYSVGELSGWKQTPWTSSSLTAELKMNGEVRVGDLAIRSAELAARAATSREQGLRGRGLAAALKAMPRTWIDDERAKAFGAARVEVYRAIASDEVTLRGHKRGVTAASFSHDGGKIVTVGEDVRIWNSATGTQIAQFTGFGSNPRIAQFSPDAKRLFVDGNFWDVTTSRRLLSLEDPDLHGSYNLFVYSPDGRRAVTSSEKRVPSSEFPGSDTLVNAIEVWETTTGKRLQTLSKKGRPVGADFSLDGRRFMAADREGIVLTWDVRTGEVLDRFDAGATVLAVAFGPEGPRVAAGDLDTEPADVRVWNAAEGVALARLKDVQPDELSFTFSADGRRIAATTDDGVALWDALSGEKLSRRAGHLGAVFGSAFSADGKRIVTFSADETARTWNAARDHVVVGGGAADGGAVFSADGVRIISLTRDRLARISDASTGRDVTPASLKDQRATSFDRQVKRILSFSYGQVKIWDAVSGLQIATLDAALSNLDRIALSPDGRRGLSIDENKAFVWDASTGKVVATLSGGEAKINYAAFSEDGERIVTPLNDCTSRIWSASTGAELAKLEWKFEEKPGFLSACSSSMWAVFSPDDRLLATLGFGSGTIWNSSTGEEVAKFGVANEGGGLAVFSPDGEHILTDTRTNDARLFETSSGKPLRDFVGHFSEIRSASFTPDGRRIMTGSADSTVRFWDVETGRELDRQVGETAAISPDGERFAIAGYSAPVRILKVGLYGPELLDAAYDLLTDDLRAEVERERIRYWEVDPALMK
ncbi:MAG: caspase family protein, partial [Parvularculaceae bacterium]